ncbi:MAG: dihydroneopterin aldolase [Alphaproteobacteria bacterium]
MRVKLKDFELTCNIGIHDWEKDFSRKLLINIEMETNNELAFTSEDITQTLDYEVVYNNIKKIVLSKKYLLIETLAHDILQMICLQKHIVYAKVEIEKLNIFPEVRACGFSIEKFLK